jgi:T5orf172 domain
MKGIVYVLTNPAMPGIVKIGHTTRSEIQQRMRELFTTGVPVPFECAFACETEDCKLLEQALHIAFGPNRIHPGREFFSIETHQPIAILKLFQKKEVTNEVNAQIDNTTTATDRVAGVKLKGQRRPVLNFLEMGIPIGSKLTFYKPELGIEVEVISERQVLFNGSESYLTPLTKEIMQLDYNVNPCPYWVFNGRSLGAFYNETYPIDSNE